MKFLGIYREERFSPGRMRDAADVMDATLQELGSSVTWPPPSRPRRYGQTDPMWSVC